MECTKCKKEKPLQEFYHHKKIDKYYSPCRDCRRLYERERYKKKKGVILEQNRRYQKANRDKMNEYSRKFRTERRERVLAHYGKECACCGEKEMSFLAIDHIDGGGREHKRNLGHLHIYTWLIRNDFPTGFQTLCHNCNYAKHIYGHCPHQS